MGKHEERASNAGRVGRVFTHSSSNIEIVRLSTRISIKGLNHSLGLVVGIILLIFLIFLLLQRGFLLSYVSAKHFLPALR